LTLIGVGNLLTAIVAGAGHYGLVAIGMVVTGCGAGVLNGDTQKAIVACVPPERTGMASGISTTTRFTAIVTSVGVLGAVLASRTRSAFDATPVVTAAGGHHFDSTFMSRVLAGDVASATANLSDAMRMVVSEAARASFASGFGAALDVAGVIALVIAIGVWVLVTPREAKVARGL